LFELNTERLLLRQWQASDSQDFVDFYSDPVMSKYVGGQRNEDDAWRGMALMVGHWQLKGFGYWAVEEKSSGDFVGCIGLWQSPGWPELELGYWLVERHQGKGYCKEAGRVCIACAKEQLNANSLVSYIDVENLPSIKLAESLGAHYEKVIELADQGPHAVYRHF
jgi:RimJ/RimL family protein N-acetyltransferase